MSNRERPSRNSKTKEMTFPRLGNGYNYQAIELESDVMPYEKTLAIMRTMDRLRKQWG